MAYAQKMWGIELASRDRCSQETAQLANRDQQGMADADPVCSADEIAIQYRIHSSVAVALELMDIDEFGAVINEVSQLMEQMAQREIAKSGGTVRALLSAASPSLSCGGEGWSPLVDELRSPLFSTRALPTGNLTLRAHVTDSAGGVGCAFAAVRVFPPLLADEAGAAAAFASGELQAAHRPRSGHVTIT